ncbi:MAG: hypothetical protein ABFS42_06775 [Candidatus Krumholzibacteriota bacterium]
MKRNLIMISLALILAAAGFQASAADVRGSLTIGTGYLENPLGVNNETAAGYLTQSLQLASSFTMGEGSGRVLKLGYEGNASQFGNETRLGNMRHGLGAEWFHNSADGRRGFGAGAQVSLRGYEDYYEIYDYSELYTYLSFKRYLGERHLVKGFAALRVRKYGELPEESFLEPHGRLEMQKFFDSRVTVGFSARYGAKFYNDSAAPSVWETLNLPSTSQVAARLNIAKGVSDRLAVRGWVDSRWNLSDFPRYVADDVFDSPLLDGYAHEGIDGFAAVKYLGPAQVWLEAGASAGDHDYGSLLFAGAPGGQTRDDRVFEYFATAEKALSGKADPPKLRLAGGWRDQDSSIEGYTYSGMFFSSSLTWRF